MKSNVDKLMVQMLQVFPKTANDLFLKKTHKLLIVLFMSEKKNIPKTFETIEYLERKV